MISIVVDTSAYSAWRRGDRDATSVVASADVFVVSPVVVGELLVGFKGGSQEKQNRQLLRQFLDQPSTLLPPIDERTAEVYAQIASILKSEGRPIPANDIWIAATAQQMSVPLWSYDRHFRAVAGVRVVATAADLK